MFNSYLQNVVVLCIVTVAILGGGFFLFNNYIDNEKQVDEAADMETEETSEGELPEESEATKSQTDLTPTITSISPSSAPKDTEVTLKGSGFTALNTIYFWGQGVRVRIPDVTSRDGETTVFTLTPAEVQYACAFQVGGCNPPPPPVLPGMSHGEYQVSMENENGTSNSVMFELTSYGLTGLASKEVALGHAPLTVDFVTGLYNMESCGNVYQWDFGDGAVENVSEPCAQDATSISYRTIEKTHVYQEPGSYTARLAIIGGKKTVESKMSVAVGTPNLECTCIGDADRNGVVNFDDIRAVYENRDKPADPISGLGDADCDGFVHYALDDNAVRGAMGAVCSE